MKSETRWLVRAWIWFWYNNTTRFLVVLFPSYFVIVVPLLQFLGLEGEAFRRTLALVYLAVFAWAVKDNNYSNLERIGLNVDRRPLEKASP
jgi:hypothetical protein